MWLQKARGTFFPSQLRRPSYPWEPRNYRETWKGAHESPINRSPPPPRAGGLGAIVEFPSPSAQMLRGLGSLSDPLRAESRSQTGWD